MSNVKNAIIKDKYYAYLYRLENMLVLKILHKSCLPYFRTELPEAVATRNGGEFGAEQKKDRKTKIIDNNIVAEKKYK